MSWTLSVDAARPEFLLYFAGADGGPPRLAAVEYGVPVFVNGLPYYGSDPPDPRAINPAPSLFGHRFDGPMRGHNAAQPWHYDLHVWLWSDNPAGTFAPWNPAWRCDGTYSPPGRESPSGPCRSSRPPGSRITGRPLATPHAIILRGTATASCGRPMRTVVAIARVVGRKCRFLHRRGRFGRKAACRRFVSLPARGSGHWRFTRRGNFPAGHYLARVRSIDTAGTVERSSTRGNHVRFRIR